MHPLDELADYLRTAPLGFVGFGPDKIARALDAIEDAKAIEVYADAAEIRRSEDRAWHRSRGI